MEKAYAIWRAFQDRILGRAAALLLLGCTLLALLEIFRRYVLGLSFEWQQDAVTFFILSGVYLYFGIAQRHDEHLNVAVLPEVLAAVGPRARRAAECRQGHRPGHLLPVPPRRGVVGHPGSPRQPASTKAARRAWHFPCGRSWRCCSSGFAFMAVTLFFQIYRGIHKLRGRSVLEEPSEESAVLH